MNDQSRGNPAGWPRITEDGQEWEARMVAGPGQVTPGDPGDDEEVLEFVCVSGERKPRRLAVRPGSLAYMSGEQLQRAFMQARPIGGDHYGRPGKRPGDAG